MNIVIRLISILFLVLFFLGCAHTPKESVALSEELGVMISSAQASHLNLIEQYISERKQQADIFINEVWIPNFMAEYMEESKILEYLENAKTDQDKTILMLQFSEAASIEISKRRSSIMDIIGEIEKSLKDKVNDHYEDMRIANQALTAHLSSAAEVTATRENLFRQFKVETDDLLPMDKISEFMEKIIGYKGDVEDLTETVLKIKKSLEEEE